MREGTRVGEALELFAQGLEAFAQGLRVLAHDEGAPQYVSAQSVVLTELWRRLGPGNRHLLATLATMYEPGRPFTLADAARSTGESPESIRGRLMNVGRSLKSMDTDASILWKRRWTGAANEYVWHAGAHDAIMDFVD